MVTLLLSFFAVVLIGYGAFSFVQNFLQASNVEISPETHATYDVFSAILVVGGFLGLCIAWT